MSDDTTDERVMAAGLTRHGQTPLISRTASGNLHHDRHQHSGGQLTPIHGHHRTKGHGAPSLASVAKIYGYQCNECYSSRWPDASPAT
jgi:hypothetical protein